MLNTPVHWQTLQETLVNIHVEHPHPTMIVPKLGIVMDIMFFIIGTLQYQMLLMTAHHAKYLLLSQNATKKLTNIILGKVKHVIHRQITIVTNSLGNHHLIIQNPQKERLKLDGFVSL